MQCTETLKNRGLKPAEKWYNAIMADFRKDIKKLLRNLERQGYTIHENKGKFKIYNDDGKFLTLIHGTPSDFRAMRHIKSKLKQNGVSVTDI